MLGVFALPAVLLAFAPFHASSERLPAPVRAELIVAAQSRTPANDQNSAWSPGFAVFDADVAARSRDLGWFAVSGGLMVVNLFDRRFDTSVVPNAARGRYFEPGPPRTVTLTLTLEPRTRGP